MRFVWQSITDASLDPCTMVSILRRALLSTARDDTYVMSTKGNVIGYLKCQSSTRGCVNDVLREGQNTRNFVDIILLWPGRENDRVSHYIIFDLQLNDKTEYFDTSLNGFMCKRTIPHSRA